MAGGTWKVQNKIRPGAYIKFKAVPTLGSVIADRGIATMPLVMDWGPEGEVIELTSADLAAGKYLEKIGYTVADPGSLLFRLCLGNCEKLLAYRVNTGTKATITLGNLTATAKYSGIRGNQISVAIIANGSSKDVVTYFAGEEKDRQTVSTIADLAANDWVTFTGTGSLSATAATVLADGTNGTATTAAYTAYFEAMKTSGWQVMGIPSDDPALPPLLTTYIKSMREDEGRKVQGVCYNYNTADYEGIISCKQGYKTEVETVSPVNFVAWVTGATAGAKANESNTYKEISGATEIINPLTDSEIKNDLKHGWFLISRRIDGQIVTEQDINTLVTFVNGERSYDFCKNRIVRALDEIGNTVGYKFETAYIGKVNNNVAGRDLFKSDLITYCKSLEAASVIQNFDKQDVTVEAGEAIDAVVVGMNIYVVDAMEKLYMTVEVG